MKEEVKLMAEKINAGTILIKEGTLLPEGVQLESDPYLKGWRLVKSPGSSGIDLKLREAGWTFFYTAGEVDAMAFGSKSEKTTQRAVQKVIAKIKSDTFNCVEISQVAAKGFRGLPYVTVAAHPRHIQESTFLFHERLAEWDRAGLAAI
jgi:hypothetical protein